MGKGGNDFRAVRGLPPGLRLGRLACLFGWMIFLVTCGGGGGGGSDASAPGPVFSISGIIQPAVGNAVDSDVNDTNATAVDNGDYASAQSISSPVILGGYINVAGSGPAGNSQVAGDPDDFFRVALNNGDAIRLSLPLGAVAGGAEVEVHIYRAADQTLVTSLLGVVRTGSVQINSTDTYYVQVHAVSGATIYKLVIGDAAALTASGADDGLILSNAFEPGEALVQWAEGVDRKVVARTLDMTGGSVSRRGRPQLMRFSGPDRLRKAFEQLHVGSRHPAARAMRRAGAADQAKLDTLAVIRALRRRPDVVLAEPNYIRRAAFDPDDPYYRNFQWNLNLINLPDAWDLTTGNANIIVAVIDTGVLPDHPDLQNKLVPGWDFITDVSSANDGDGPDEDPSDPGDGTNNDSSFHGTLVAGIVAAGFNNGIGIAGVAGAARIMPVRVLGVKGGTDNDLIAAIEFAAGLNDQVNSASATVPAQPADIINLSLGGPQHSAALDAALARARGQGVIITAAAGNTGNSEPQYPAASPGVVSVAAVDTLGQRTYYTSFGTTVDVAAPGGDFGVDLNNDSHPDGILSTGGSDAGGAIQTNYTFAFGTSFAAPHMAGVAALMKTVRAGLTPDEVDAYLTGGAITTDIGDSGLGAGLLDAALAVQAAATPTAPTVLSVSPNAVRFDGVTDSASVKASKLGPDILSVTSWTTDASWLSVVPSSTDADGLGTYTMNVDRTGLSGGLYTGTVTIGSTVNTVLVPVQMEVLPDTTADAGFQYVLVMNLALTQVVAQRPAVMQNGVSTFNLAGIPPGTYYLVAGTDLDNDGIVVEPGEAWGIYASASDPVPIIINSGDVSGFTFSAGFSWSLFADTVSIQSMN